VTILLAEDDDGHATLIQRNLQRTKLNPQIVRFRDGQEVVDYLAKPRPVPKSSDTVVLLLDIRMPRLDGMEVLRRIKTDPATKAIPVFMLTTTDNPQEVDRCFSLGCNIYLTKPVEYSAFTAAMQRLSSFLEVMQFPARESKI
jgi:CheY-like chemotaxis protein